MSLEVEVEVGGRGPGTVVVRESPSVAPVSPTASVEFSIFKNFINMIRSLLCPFFFGIACTLHFGFFFAFPARRPAPGGARPAQRGSPVRTAPWAGGLELVRWRKRDET